MQSKIKISSLAPLGFSLIIGLTIINNLLFQGSLSKIRLSVDAVNHSNLINQKFQILEKLLLDAETGQRGFLYTGQEKYLAPYETGIKLLDKVFLELRSSISLKNNRDLLKNLDPEEEKLINKQLETLQIVQNLSQRKTTELEQTIRLKRAGQDQAARNIVLTDEGKITMDEIRMTLQTMKSREIQLLEGREKEVSKTINFSISLIWLSTLITISIGIIIGVMIARLTNHLLGIVIKVAQQVSRGDLTTAIEVSSHHDEIGKLLEAFQRMTHNLNSLISQVRNSGIQVTSSSTEIAAANQQLEATLTEQVAATTEVSATTRQIAATSNQLVHTMEQVAQMVGITANTAGLSQQDLQQMQNTISQLATGSRTISSQLGSISDKANNITGIITTITKVADQTNLLSLNAAIEAEKAGEYGAGFAVVAREIRRLADQSAAATLEIETTVKQMQSAVATGVMEMDKFSRQVGQSVEDIDTLTQRMNNIIEQVQNLSPRFESVNQGMEDQAKGAQQIQAAMEQLQQASQQTASSVRETGIAICQLREVAQQLQGEISRFKV